MNKQLILKFKAEFNHWLYGGKILVNNIGCNPPNWVPIESISPMWECEYDNYIINDEYVEFRKAQVEGKTIQVLDKYIAKGNNGEYFVKGATDSFCYPVAAYRIKPEPPFKVGDYVRHPDNYIFIANEDFIRDLTEIESSERWTLWTLESASDDEWVVEIKPKVIMHPGKIECQMFVVFPAHVAKKMEKNVVPYIGQTPEQLGFK